MIRPIIAAIIVLRAASTLPLSPPERIHLIPPQIRKKRAIIAATTRMIIIVLLITVPRLVASVQRVPNLEPDSGQRLTF